MGIDPFGCLWNAFRRFLERVPIIRRMGLRSDCRRPLVSGLRREAQTHSIAERMRYSVLVCEPGYRAPDLFGVRDAAAGAFDHCLVFELTRDEKLIYPNSSFRGPNLTAKLSAEMANVLGAVDSPSVTPTLLSTRLMGLNR